MLSKLRTSFLLPAELADFIKKMIAIVEESGITHEFLLSIVGLLKVDLEGLRAALTAVRQNVFVEEAAAADAVRDDLFISFRDTVDAAKRRKTVEIVEAHQLIYPLIKSAGVRLYLLGYSDKSGKLEALLETLEDAKYDEALVTLKVDDLFTELKDAQEEFARVYGDRLQEDSNLKYPTLDEAKRNAVPHINIFLGVVNVLQELEPATFALLEEKINNVTTEMMAIARARKTRSENDDADDNSDDAAGGGNGPVFNPVGPVFNDQP